MGAPVRIPGVVIGDELGQGAYSVVHRARRGDVRCALKVPRARGKWTRWVYREAVALARVRHPGLPRVLEVGEADGLPYLLMELVEGETLSDRLLRGAMQPDEALDVACQLADTLRAVHEVGLVHRDVKPRNVILDAAGKARLVDFGFAAPAGSVAPGDAAGTRHYSAPEQFRTPDRVDARADLYALGRVLLECLTGRPCTDADATRAVVGLATAGVRAAIVRILVGLVAERPADRYPDTAALLGELHRVRAGGLPRGVGACEPARVRSALVGRDAELERFTGAWLDVQASGGRVLLVEGIRGAGKTCFVRTCAARVLDEGRGRVLDCTSREGDAPLAAMRRMFDSCVASLPRLPPQERAAATTALRSAAAGPLATLVRTVSPAFAELLGGRETAGQVPDAFAEGVAELVIRLARLAGPFLLSFDDLQWIDLSSLEVLAAIAGRAHEAPLLLLAAARPAAAGATFGRFEPAGPKGSIHLTLGPLDVRQSAALVADHLGVASADPAVVRRIVAVADGTPVGVLEALGAYLDAGALRLRNDAWELDPAAADRVALPSGALAYLGRRVGELPAAARRVLEVAAVIGSRFEDALLADVLDLGLDDVGYALADGRRAGLLESVDGRTYVFAHDSVREVLAEALDDVARRRWHQRTGECLLGRAEADADALHACATHLAAGEAEKAPAVAYRIARRAGEAALERFDNETALRFFEMARSSAGAAGLTLDAAFHRKVGEAHLRVGALDESLRALESALQLAQSALDRAQVLGRIAWLRRARSEPDEAWSALDRAFVALAVDPPTDHEVATGRPRRQRLPDPCVRDALYELYHQHARLGMECGKPHRTLQSTMRVLALARGEGPSAALARTHATYGAVLTFAQRRVEGNRHLAIAEAMATALAEPSTLAFCLQRRFVALAYLGEFDAALVLLRRCADEYGAWLEIAEYCLCMATGNAIETLRGRALEAWAWISRANGRVGHERTAQVPAYVFHRARAALASLGRSGDEEPWVSAQLEMAAAQGPERAFYRLLCWGPQARHLLETGNLGPAFEDLVRRFEAEGHDPAATHPGLVEYYVCVAHARIHQCLRATAEERAERVACLRKAASDLRTAAKLAPYRTHALLADGYLAWFEGHRARADRLLAQAEGLALRETCPWVLSGVARARAHMLREGGKHDAARDQARIAETLAREHGAEPRARCIREEFSLPAPQASHSTASSTASSRASSRRARRQLASLLHVVRAPHGQLPRAKQGAAIADDVVRELAAERAFLVFEPTDDPRARLVLGRTRVGETLASLEAWREALLRAVISHGEEWVDSPDGARSRAGTPDAGRSLTVPLFLHERVVGAVRVERAATDAPFAPDDLELLRALAHQVPIALDLSRVLEERDQLQATVQQAQKMELVGMLAGSVAHDLNQALGIAGSTLELLRENRGLDKAVRADIELVKDGFARVNRLVGKLLSISREHPIALGATDVNASVTGLQRALESLSSPERPIGIDLRCGGGPHWAIADESSLDQALLNLAVNARDAMPRGGTLTISTENVVLGEDAVRRGASSPGDHVVVGVTDTGEGIPPDVMPRIFDPFFTTKPPGKGTGFGLTSVYAFVRKCGGHVEVSSEVGRGTTFRLYFPRAEPPHVAKRRSTRPPPPPRVDVTPFILVVDDDQGVREVVRRLLEVSGYRVQAASGSDEALEVMRSRGAEVGLVISDLNMPGMSGAVLDARLAEMKVAAKVLFMTGDGPEAVPGGAERHLQKPFELKALLARVEALLAASRPTSGASS